jgi:pyridoxamine 5'-phosphate oxidase-like protein
VCFEVDEAGDMVAYGRFECDTSIAYRSVVAFGRIRVVEETASKTRFFTALVRTYGDAAGKRPPGLFPRLGDITLYALTLERLTGKETPLPEVSRRWPALDGTKTSRGLSMVGGLLAPVRASAATTARHDPSAARADDRLPALHRPVDGGGGRTSAP